jgi:hypothetical protein
MTMTLARAICRLEEAVVVVTGGDYTTGKMGIGKWQIWAIDAKSADSRCLSAPWQKQGGEEETFSPAALRLYLYTRSIYLTRLLSYAYPTLREVLQFSNLAHARF